MCDNSWVEIKTV